MRQLNENDPTLPDGVDFDSYLGTSSRFHGAYAVRAVPDLAARLPRRAVRSLEDPSRRRRTSRPPRGIYEFFPSEFSKLVAGYERSWPAAGTSRRTASCSRRRSRWGRTSHIRSEASMDHGLHTSKHSSRCRSVCLARSTRRRRQLKVVTSTTDLYDIARAGRRRRGSPRRTSARAIRTRISSRRSRVSCCELRKADVWAFVGLDLEIGWMPLLLDGRAQPEDRAGRAGPPRRVHASFAVLDVPSGNVDRSQGDVHPLGNPHYWLDPENGRRIARCSATRFSKLDPKNAADYARNTTAFEATAQRGREGLAADAGEAQGQAGRGVAHELALLRRLHGNEHRRVHGAQARRAAVAVAPDARSRR